MPSERRKEQNRINQRRYRQQLKNRIQMLEKVIIEARSSSGDNVNLGTATSDSGSLTFDENSIPSDEEAPIATSLGPNAQDQLAQTLNETSSQDGATFEKDDLVNFWDETDLNCASLSDDFFSVSGIQNPWLPVGVGYEDHSNSSPNTSFSRVGDCSVPNIANSQTHLNQLEDCNLNMSVPPDTVAENVPATRSKKRTKKVSKPNKQSSEASSKLSKKIDQDEKNGTITSLRAENRRLKELSAALAHMYDTKNLPRNSFGHLADSQALVDDANMISSPESISYFGNSAAGSYQSHGFNTPDYFPMQTPRDAELFSPSQYPTDHTGWLHDPVYTSGFHAGSPGSTQAQTQASHQRTAKNSHHTTPPNTSCAYTGSTQSYHLGLNRAHGFTSHPNPITQAKDLTPLLLNPSPFLQTLPSPSTYEHLEPTFTRRLLRRCFQIGYHLLLNSSAYPPQILSRIYDFCLARHSIDEVIEKMRHCLGLGSGGEMVADQLRWGRVPDRRDCVELGGLGEGAEVWMEVADVEGWLKGRGIGIEGGAEQVQNHKSQYVPYGTVWCPTASVANGGPSTEALLAVCFQEAATGRAATAALPRKVDLNIDNFFECLMQHSICLGRTAGFRRVDVEHVFQRCVELESNN